MLSIVRRMMVVAVAAVMLALFTAMPAFAHMHRTVGTFATGVGWVEEPAFAGFRNAVQFEIHKLAAHADGHDHAAGDAEAEEGTPVTNAKLKVEVIFGDQNGTQKTDPLDLVPAYGVDGEYHAYLVPTEPGTYTFHIYGTVGKTEFDQYYTSGESGPQKGDEGAYNDMRAPTDVQFPVKEPSGSELATKIDRVDARLSSSSDSAGTKGLLGIILGAVALVVAAGGVVAGRKGKAA